jgi:UDP-hydrolysing UDP-N-acetyl-D-glucosamine 2-epimerase
MTSMKKLKFRNLRIAVFTGSRAEYGLLKNLILKLQVDPAIDLAVFVGGQHLSKTHSSSYNEILADGVKIHEFVGLNAKSDTPVSLSDAMSCELIGRALNSFMPDCLVLLGDRVELMPVALSAVIQSIPIAHIHGGEVTNGAFDDMFRHAISKMSSLHFVAAEEYRNRLIRMGENPNSVFVVGSLGAENVLISPSPKRSAVFKKVLAPQNDILFVITVHPETIDRIGEGVRLPELFEALDTIKNKTLVFTGPNSDPGSEKIRAHLKDYVNKRDCAVYHESLGHDLYVKLLKLADICIGNSSSGIIEAPAANTPSINLGYRQVGRLMAETVYSCEWRKHEIVSTINKVLGKKVERVKDKLQYAPQNTSEVIYKKLSEFKKSDFYPKYFFDG